MIVTNFTAISADVTLADGTVVLFVKGLPVAALVPGKGWLRSDSAAGIVSKVISLWFAKHKGEGASVKTVPSWEIEQLVAF